MSIKLKSQPGLQKQGLFGFPLLAVSALSLSINLHAANPTAINGTPFVLVGTDNSNIQLFGLASDDQGRVYAGNNSNGGPGLPPLLFNPTLYSGTPIPLQNLGSTFASDGDGIAFGNGFLFIADGAAGVRKISVATGEATLFTSDIGHNATGSPMVYRPSDAHLFIGLGGLTGLNRIDEYNAAGLFLKSHTTGTDVETMTFDPQSGLIYYAPFGSSVRALNPITDVDRSVGNVSGTIDGALAFDPISKRLFVGMANGANAGYIETMDIQTGATSPFASGFDNAVGILREPTSGNLYFLNNDALYMLGSTNVNNSLPPVGLKINWSNQSVATTWQVGAGSSYQLQFTPDLVTPAWTNISNPFPAISNRLDLLDTKATNFQGFYRALLVP